MTSFGRWCRPNRWNSGADGHSPDERTRGPGVVSAERAQLSDPASSPGAPFRTETDMTSLHRTSSCAPSHARTATGPAVR
jgi:hypothetical protein